MRIPFTALAITATALLGATAAAQPEATPAQLEFFETKVRPVLVEHCYKCHSTETGKRKGGLQLDTRDALRGGGDSGPALVAGDPDKSLIIKAVRRSSTELEMPPDEKLPANLIADLEAWVKMGAPDPRAAKLAGKIQVDVGKARAHWAFQAPKDPPLPTCARLGWCRTGVDNFVVARLTEKGIEPAPAADRRTLIRRATFDLLGLPPTPAEVEAFVADRSSRPFEKLVDRLLASPRYGERWGRLWLDVARYSDTKGYVFREERRYPFAWTYRDWVIRSLNEDMPYDRFLTYQLAADRLVKGEDKRPLAAMGFLTLGRRFLNRAPDIIDDRIDVVARGTMALTVGCARCHDHKFDPIPTKDYYALYGVFASSEEPKELPIIAGTKKTKETIAYDKEIGEKKAAADEFRKKKHDELLAALRAPKAIADYLVAAHEAGALKDPDAVKTLIQKRDLRQYLLDRWSTLIKKSGEPGSPLAEALLPVRNPAAPIEAVREAAEKVAPQLADAEPLKVGLADTEKLCNRADREKLQDLERKVEEVRATHPGAPTGAHVLVDAAKPITPRVFVRGNPDNPGEEVPRQFLTVLSRPAPQPFRDGSGRLELARAIASADNPLTARVLVNRVWLQHFGTGIVRTPSDFGLRSEPPTHPELLDWLARRFVDGGWSLKKLHRLIMLSAAYQQSSEPTDGAREKDPDNALYSRMNRRRLDFEGMRDSLLAAAGRLDTTTGGRPLPFVSNASAKTRQEAETIRNEAAGDPTQDVYARRRSVYLFVDRQNLPSVFRDFDFASPDAHSPQRYTTSVPQQALFLMNSPFVVEQARALVARSEVAREKDPERRTQALYRLAFGRPARADEVTLARRFLDAASAPRPEPLVDGGVRPQVWLYGFGAYDAAAKRVAAFTPLPHFSGQAWQGAAKMPDATLGWTMLSAGGGHPGRDPQHAAIRRWVAPRDGEVTIAGALSHASDRGDGIEARIVSSRTGEIASFAAHNTEAETRIARLEVKQGETIDFVVDCRGDDGFDGFTWAPMISMKTVSAATGGEMTVEWSASGEFAGPSKARALGAWQKLAQVLLVSNEFMFVD